MDPVFDINKFKAAARSDEKRQYYKQLKRLEADDLSTESVERAVQGAMANLDQDDSRSFVIYGEPQSGKTEMMICLTAKLLDAGHRLIIHMLNDSVDLLDQNLRRFHAAGLAPPAQNFSEIMDPSIHLSTGTHVVFCKKNTHNLQDLINKLDGFDDLVVIDDEADYASPNSKVNKQEKSKINDLIDTIIRDEGRYIGVTATPARLNLNNTFSNDSGCWVKFPPHPLYTGQDTFFPMNLLAEGKGALDYILTLIPDDGSDPKYERRAILSFLVNVAHLNLTASTEKNWSLLIHTSGQKVDHRLDLKTVRKTFRVLDDENDSQFANYIRLMWEIARERYPDSSPDELVHYVLANRERRSTIVMNSEKEFKKVGQSATDPTALFTIVIGGNIVSRGVTLKNLLSMFFTRDVKHKLQQDTYIQRARMFGSRGGYLNHFELTIPQKLFADWHRCFVYHRLALASIDNGFGSPVWISDKRIAAVASPSIDQSTVDMDKGEMSFAIFDYVANDWNLDWDSLSDDEALRKLREIVPDESFPAYLRQFISQSIESAGVGLKVMTPKKVFPGMSSEEQERIERRRGFITIRSEDRREGKSHFIRVFFNSGSKARLFYKLAQSIQFIKNLK